MSSTIEVPTDQLQPPSDNSIAPADNSIDLLDLQSATSPTSSSSSRPIRTRKPNPDIFSPTYVTAVTTTNFNKAISSGKFFLVNSDVSVFNSEDLLWQRAMNSEIDQLNHISTWTPLSVLPPNASALNYKWVHEVKSDGTHRSRLTVKGCGQRYGRDFSETFAPVVRLTIVRLIFVIAIIFNLELYSLDVVTAFPNADLDDDIFMKCPPEVQARLKYPDDIKFLKLNRALYGLKQASRQWYIKLSSTLLANGFVRSSMDPCVFFSKTSLGLVWAVIYVDDILIAARNLDQVEAFHSILLGHFKTKLTPCTRFIGIDVQYDREERTVTTSQTKHIVELVAKFESKLNIILPPADSPLRPNIKLSKFDPSIDEPCDPTVYRSIIGALNFISCASRYDITYSVNYMAQFMHCPSVIHFNELLHILSYLKSHPNLPIVYAPFKSPHGADFSLVSFVDANHAGCPFTFHSTGGHFIFLANGLLCWESKKDSTASPGGTTNSEYKFLYNLAIQLRYLREFLSDINIPQLRPSLIFEDNLAAIAIALANEQFHGLKHLAVKYHAIKEWIAEGEFVINHVDGDNQLADVTTKSNPPSIHSAFIWKTKSFRY
jgi:hypothetical protein